MILMRGAAPEATAFSGLNFVSTIVCGLAASATPLVTVYLITRLPAPASLPLTGSMIMPSPFRMSPYRSYVSMRIVFGKVAGNVAFKTVLYSTGVFVTST